MLQVWRGEGCLGIYSLVASFKAEKRKVNVSDAWFRVSPLSLSLSLSPPLSLVFWSADCRLPSFDLGPVSLSREICLLHHFSHLIWSNWVFFVFYRIGHRMAEKSLLIIFIFWQILSTFPYMLILCTETPSFYFEESLSNDNIRWMLSWALVALLILCVR